MSVLGYNVASTDNSVANGNNAGLLTTDSTHFALASIGSVYQVSVYGAMDSGTSNAKAIIYLDNAGAPGAYQGVSDITVVNTTLQWWVFTFATPLILNPGTYWIGVVSQTASFYIRLDYISGSASDKYYRCWSTSPYSNPEDWTTDESNTGYVACIYADYVVVPTFGNTSEGTKSDGYTQQVYAQQFTLSEEAPIHKIRVFQDGSGQNCQVGIYADSSGSPGELLASSDVLNVSGPANWYTFVIECLLEAGTYWLAWIADSSSAHIYEEYTGGTFAYRRPGSFTLPDPFGTPTGTGTNNLSIYAVYADLLTKTVKPTGGDYAHLEDAVSYFEDNYSDFVLANIYGNISIDGDWSGGVDDTPVNISDINTDSMHTFKISTTAQARHKGKYSEDYYMLRTTDWAGTALNNTVGYLTVEGIQIDRSYSGGNAICVNNGSTVNSIFDGILACGAYQNYKFGYDGTATTLRNCLSFDAAYAGFWRNYGGNAYIYNCTSVDSVRGFAVAYPYGAITFTNCLATHNSSVDFDFTGGGTITVTNCASSDQTADDEGGSGNQVGVSTTNLYIDYANDDFHLDYRADTKVFKSGSDLSSLFATDIDGNNRRVAIWDIGADEMNIGQTPILDGFDRGDSSTLGANWTETGDGIGISSNLAKQNSGANGWGDATWIANSFSNDCEAYLTLSALPTSYPVLLIWNSANKNGYAVYASGGHNGLWVQRIVGGDPGSDIISYSHTISAGDSMLVACIGSTIVLGYKASGGSWVPVASITDATYSTRNQFVILFQDTTVRGDNFGGGSLGSTVVSNAVTTTPITMSFSIVSPTLYPRYSRGSYSTLPSDDSDLSTICSLAEIANLISVDGNYVGIAAATSQYPIMLFKDPHNNNSDQISFTWTGRGFTPSSSKPIYLQIFNKSAGTWETLSSKTDTTGSESFTLTGNVTSNLSNYYNSTFMNLVVSRIYQEK